MNTDYIIRPFESGELDLLVALRKEALISTPEAFGSNILEGVDPEKFRPVLEERAAGQFILGVFHEGEAVGMIGYRRSKKVNVPHIGYIWGMFISEEYRGNGLGRRLINECIERAKSDPGLEQIHLSVTASQTAARELYESAGFQVVGFSRAAMKIEGKYYDDESMILFLYQPPVEVESGGDNASGCYLAMLGLLGLVGFIVYLFVFWLNHLV